MTPALTLPRRLSRWALTLAAATLPWLALPARADLLIGQTTDLSGPSAASVAECNAGAKLVFDAVNAQGGINGQPIRLITLDDAYEPAKAATNAKALIDQGVLALFLNRGTPHTQAMLPLLAQYQVPMVAPSTGAMLLRQPVNPWVWNVRASYQHEAARTVSHLLKIGASRVALLQADDTFGSDAVLGALQALKDADKRPVLHLKFDRSKPDFATLIPAVIKADAQAVLIIGSTAAVADAIHQLRDAGSHALAATLSNNASAGFIKALGAQGRGVLVSQVFPPERSGASGFVRGAQDLVRAHPGMELSPQMIEGYAGARVLVEALRKAGPKPDRASLRKALDSLGPLDLDGLKLNWSPTNHDGLDYADLSIIDGAGRYRR